MQAFFGKKYTGAAGKGKKQTYTYNLGAEKNALGAVDAVWRGRGRQGA